MRVEEVTDNSPLWHWACSRHGDCAQWHAARIDGGDHHFFIAVDAQGMYLGGAVIDIGPERQGPLAGTTVGVLEEIRVEDAARRQGIGTQLVRAALNLAWRRGAAHVRWTCDFRNAEGIAFYTALGFALVPEYDPEARNADHYYLVVAQRPVVPAAPPGE